MSSSSYSLPDSLSIGAIIFAGISGCFMFIKTIKKCRISRKGLELEREMDKERDLVNQQEFMLNLIKVVQKENNAASQPPPPPHLRRCASDDSLPWNKSQLSILQPIHHNNLNRSKQELVLVQPKAQVLPPERNPKLHPEDLKNSNTPKQPLHKQFIVRK